MVVTLDRLEAELAEMQGYKQDFSIHPRIAERRILIASDVHIPYHHVGAVAKMLRDADKYSVDAVVWLGDFVDNMMHSRYGNTDLRSTFRDQMEQAGFILRKTAEVVPVQYWSMGNHEYRWMTKMGYQGDMEMFARLAGVGDLMDEGQLIVSDDPTWEYVGDGSEWMLTHPEQYGSQPLAVPGKLADKHLTNIVAGHAHHWAMGTSPSGRYTVIESGGLYDAGKVQYVQHKVTANRAWVRGYVILDDGEPTLIRA